MVLAADGIRSVTRRLMSVVLGSWPVARNDQRWPQDATWNIYASLLTTQLEEDEEERNKNRMITRLGPASASQHRRYWSLARIAKQRKGARIFAMASGMHLGKPTKGPGVGS